MGQMESKSGYLAEDVLIEILSRMSVKFLLRFRRESIGLWNPATRAFRALSLCRTKLFPCDWIPCHCGFGFGLDPTSDDYKVVWIRTFDDGDTSKWDSWMDPIHVAVYTLSTDSWKDFKGDAPDCLHSLTESCFDSYLNGVYYWWSPNGKLVSFDMGKEEFKEIQGPPLIHQDSASEILTLYNGSIALIYSHSLVPLDSWESVEQSSVAVWVLMEEEGMGCWIKQLNIGPLHGMMRPVGVWNNDEIFVETTPGHLLLYDPNTQRVLKCAGLILHDIYKILGTDLSPGELWVSRLSGQTHCSKQLTILGKEERSCTWERYFLGQKRTS
ncbi:unnamed protein product [Ilex paraguariensis]|uniref:F-box associated beta-propeller type 3 domain-containing protein n=1 Tax=Ilex paraguariensis TaxID=185542 RepID=A0ABC8U197_9AQUA